jgi:hypothetical protein
MRSRLGPVLELEHHAVEEIAPAELGLVELGARVVVVEDELPAEELEERADQEEKVGRIAGVDHVESTGKKYLQ